MLKNHRMLTFVLLLALCTALLAGCVTSPRSAASALPNPTEEDSAAQTAIQTETLTGGVLCLKINPEIALHYDENGKVTKLEGRNADGERILENITDYVGKETAQVLEVLVEAIGKAGYFVEEAEGSAGRIVLELDPGSQVPHDRFLEDMAAHVKSCVEGKNWIAEREYEYAQKTAQEATVPAAEPSGLCPVCGDDCDDGKYCDDWDEKAENLREHENRKSGAACEICGDYDCDDGKYCDDWDDRCEEEDHHDDWDNRHGHHKK